MSRFVRLARTAVLAGLVLAGPAALARDDPAGVRDTAAKATARLADLQKKLAAAPGLDRLRLDGFTAGDQRVRVAGVFLNPGADATERDAAFDQMVGDLNKLVRDDLELPNLGLDAGQVKRVEWKDQPHVVLQKLANETGGPADEVKLDGCRFDAAGRLALFGWVGAKAGKAWLAAAAANHLGETPLGGKGAATLDGVTAVEWKLTPAAVQTALAGSAAASLRRVRADRLLFVHRPVKDEGGRPVLAWSLRVRGLKVGTEGVEDAALFTLLKRTWPEVFASGGPKVLVDLAALSHPGKRVPEPIAAFRKAVAARPDLDGTRIDGPLEFAAGGELAPAGVRPGLDAAGRKALTEVVNGVLLAEAAARPDGPAFPALTARGLALERMATVETPRLLRDLQAWAAGRLEDVRLTRLFFDADGTYRLTGQAARAADKAVVLQELARVAGLHLPPAATDPGGPVAVDLAAIPGLTAHLRKLLAAEPAAWDGVLLERGFFDTTDQYTLAGVVDRDGQNAPLDALLKTLRGAKQWDAYFLKPPAPVALTTMPLAPLLARVRRMAPGYPVYDGVVFEKVRHDASGKLVFDVRTVGHVDAPAAAKALAGLLETHPDWKRRAGRGVDFAVTTAADGDVDLTTQMQNRSDAIKRIRDNKPGAKALLDDCLLHSRQDSALWFLSAYYHYFHQTDEELVRRDLWRVIVIEGSAGDRKQARADRQKELEPLPGADRDRLNGLLEQYHRDFKSGKKLIELVAPKP